MCISFSAWSSPDIKIFPKRDSVALAERKIAKIERQRQRIMKRWDERTLQRRKTDRRAVIFLVISAGILANSMAHKE